MTKSERMRVPSDATVHQSKGRLPSLPGDYFGIITDHGISKDSSGRTTFWLDFMTDSCFLARVPKGNYTQDRKFHIVFDGTVRIGGRKTSIIPERVRAALKDHCRKESEIDGFDHEFSDLYGLVGQELACRCRLVENENGATERWSILEV